MKKIRKNARDEKINFRKLLPLFFLIFAALSPLRVARAGVIQDVLNGLKDGFHAGSCVIDVGDEYCKVDLIYFPRGNYDRNFTVSSHIEDNIKMEKKKILFGTWTYYVGKGKVEYKTTRFDLDDSNGKAVAKIHGYAIPTVPFLAMEAWKGQSETAGITEEISPFTSVFSVSSCKIQTGSNSCVATVTIKVPNSFKKDMTLESEDGKAIELQRDGLLNYLNILVKRFVGYGPTKYPTTTFILRDNKGRVMNVGVAKASCQDKKATVNDEGYCVVDQKEGSEDGSVVTGNNESVIYTAKPSPCTIKEERASCDVLFSWDLTNLAYNTRIISKYVEIYEKKGEEEEEREIMKESFNSKKPYGSKSLSISYPGGSYSLAIKEKNKPEILDSLVVRAECESGTKWNGSKCARYETMGEIKPEFSQCEIKDGSSNCSVELVWKTTDPDPTKTSRVMSGDVVIEEANMGNKTISVSYPQSTYTLEHKGKILGTAYANSYCEAGAIWNGSKCESKICPPLPEPDKDKNEGETPVPDWSEPKCGECIKETCKKSYKETQIITCTQYLGEETRSFQYNCCVPQN